jgi:hypothetical protein
MGSSKKPKKHKVEAADDRAASNDAALPALPRAEPDTVAALCLAVEELGRRFDVLERQVERTLLLQERTNTLLELLAGAAFDMELGGPPQR